MPNPRFQSRTRLSVVPVNARSRLSAALGGACAGLSASPSGARTRLSAVRAAACDRVSVSASPDGAWDRVSAPTVDHLHPPLGRAKDHLHPPLGGAKYEAPLGRTRCRWGAWRRRPPLRERPAVRAIGVVLLATLTLTLACAAMRAETSGAATRVIAAACVPGTTRVTATTHATAAACARVGSRATAATRATAALPMLAALPAGTMGRSVPRGPLAARTVGDGNGLGFSGALVLGIVEGVTEYLPVSSTGHLLVVEQALGISGNIDLEKAADAYAICIQFGAIMAVLVLYWGRFVSIVKGVLGRDPVGRRLAWVLLASFIPAAAIGVLGESLIKEYLFAIWPIVGAWVVGGIVILVVAHHDSRSGRRPTDGVPMERLSTGRAVIIGLLQCVAMWPGISRSLATILGGRLVGLSTAAAVEYSFLLGLITLTAATVYSTVKDGALIVETLGIVAPVVGVVVAFLSAAVAVKWMVAYLNRHSLAVFGWYRIALGAVVAGLVLGGVL